MVAKWIWKPIEGKEDEAVIKRGEDYKFRLSYGTAKKKEILNA